MKNTLLTLLLFINIAAFAQQTIVVTVMDSTSKKPLDFVSLSIAKKSNLTNEFGEAVFYGINIQSIDTLYISCIGYKSTKLAITTKTNFIKVYLRKESIDLKEVEIKTYTDISLAKLLLTAYKNTAEINKSFAAEIKSYSIKNGEDPVENISGLYNINYNKNTLYSISLKYGIVTFPKENISNNFLSVGISKIYVFTNPFGTANNNFKSPFKLSTSRLLAEYKIHSSVINSMFLKVYYQSKLGLSSGYVIIDLQQVKIRETNTLWKFDKKYPLVSLNEGSLISDTMSISSTAYFDSRLQNQSIQFKFTYNNDTITTNSVLSYIDSSLYHIPFNSIEFENDYLNIISKPKLKDEIIHTTLENRDAGKLNKIFKEGIAADFLVEGFDIDKQMIENWTDLGFYSDDWQLNLTKIKTGGANQQYDTKIKTFVYADFILHKDSIIFIVEPFFDYATSVYCYFKSPEAAMFISNYMYLTKIEANNLLNTLKNEFKTKVDSKRFDEVCKLHEAMLRKRILQYKFETNGGTNEQEMTKWNKIIFSELNH